jgi:hypothetical protein
MSLLIFYALVLTALPIKVTGQQAGQKCVSQSYQNAAQAYSNCCPAANKQEATVAGKQYTLHCDKEVVPGTSLGNDTKACADACSSDESCIGSYWSGEGFCFPYQLAAVTPDPQDPLSSRIAMVPFKPDTVKDDLLKTCNGDLSKCKSDLSNCTTDRGNTNPRCPADLTKCNSDLTQCNTDLRDSKSKCATDLTKCNGDLTKCQTDLEKSEPKCPAALTKCKSDLEKEKGTPKPLKQAVREKCGSGMGFKIGKYSYTFFAQCEILGNDYYRRLTTPLYEDCRAACAADRKCLAGVRVFGTNSECYLYSKKRAIVKNHRAMSVVLRI